MIVVKSKVSIRRIRAWYSEAVRSPDFKIRRSARPAGGFSVPQAALVAAHHLQIESQHVPFLKPQRMHHQTTRPSPSPMVRGALGTLEAPVFGSVGNAACQQRNPTSVVSLCYLRTPSANCLFGQHPSILQHLGVGGCLGIGACYAGSVQL